MKLSEAYDAGGKRADIEWAEKFSCVAERICPDLPKETARADREAEMAKSEKVLKEAGIVGTIAFKIGSLVRRVQIERELYKMYRD